MQRYFLSLSQPDYYVSTIVKTNLSKCKNLKKELLELIDYFPQGKYFEKIVIIQPKQWISLLIGSVRVGICLPLREM